MICGIDVPLTPEPFVPYTPSPPSLAPHAVGREASRQQKTKSMFRRLLILGSAALVAARTSHAAARTSHTAAHRAALAAANARRGAPPAIVAARASRTARIAADRQGRGLAAVAAARASRTAAPAAADRQGHGSAAVVATPVSQIAAPADSRAHNAAPVVDAVAEAGGARSDSADFADFTDTLADAESARSDSADFADFTDALAEAGGARSDTADFAELTLPSRRAHSAAPAADALAEAGGARLDTADLMNLILPNLRCPITSSLLVCPVRAEDGHIYEADALERWLRSSRRSPLTNKPMGAETTKSGRTRSLILAAIENGVVDDEAAATWYLESAKAIAAGKLPVKMSAAVAYMDRAIFLSASTEVALVRRAVAIKAEMVALDDQRQALMQEASRCGTDAVSVVFGGDDYAPMMSFLALRNGHSKIRVIYDPDEFRRLCERPAPGAFSEVGWDDGMADHCGKEFIVRHQSDRRLKSYRIEDADGDELSVPFDACILTRL